MTGADRGQTSIDYAIGIGIFMSALLFSLAFIPSLIGPFTDADESHKVIGNRVGDALAQDFLVDDPSEPYVLDPVCTERFFNGTQGSCRFQAPVDGDQWDLNDAVGVREGVFLNVSVTDGTDVVTYDGTDLAAGPNPPSSGSVTRAGRTVRLDDTTYRLVVRLW